MSPKSDSPRFRIQVTLLFFISCLLILTVTAIGLAFTVSAHFSSRELSEQICRQAARLIEQKVLDLLQASRRLADTNRNLVLSGTIPATASGTLTALFFAQIQEYGAITNVIMGTPAGETRWAFRDARETVRMRLLYPSTDQRFMAHDLDFENWKLRTTEEFEDRPYDPRLRPWYIEAVKARRGAWTESYLFFSSSPDLPHIPGCSYAVPVIPPGGDEITAIMLADFDFFTACRFLRELKVSPNGIPFVVEIRKDGEQRVIIHPDPVSLLIKDETSRDAKAVRLRRPDEFQSEPVRRLCALLAESKPKQASDTESFAFHAFQAEGEAYLGALYRPADFTGFAFPRWAICIAAPRRDFFERVDRMLGWTLFSALLGLVAGLYAGYRIARSISEPLKTLAEETTRVSGLDLEARPPPETRVLEIANLARAMEDMKAGLRNFQKFISRDLVRSLIQSGKEATLGGECRTLSIAFSGVDNFDDLAIALAPAEKVNLLNEILDDLTRATLAHGGTLDKYLGESVMAFWGAPYFHDRHAVEACLAGLACLDRLATLEDRLVARGLPKPAIGIGVSTGEMVVGNMGSEERLNYTVIGDDVNLASRIRNLNRFYGTRILVSSATWYRVEDRLLGRLIDRVSVKGKSVSLTIHEIFCPKEKATPDLVAAVHTFESALAALFRRDWEVAEAGLRDFLSFRPEDRPALHHLDRVRKFRVSPPPPDWNGVTAHETK